jgi:hypothetical protein
MSETDNEKIPISAAEEPNTVRCRSHMCAKHTNITPLHISEWCSNAADGHQQHFAAGRFTIELAILRHLHKEFCLSKSCKYVLAHSRTL